MTGRSRRASPPPTASTSITASIARTSATREAVVRRSAEASGRNPDEIEIRQIAALDCSDDGESSRRAIGKSLAFITGDIVGSRDPVTQGVPPERSEAVKELRANTARDRARRTRTRRAARALRLPLSAPRDLRDAGRVPYASWPRRARPAFNV